MLKSELQIRDNVNKRIGMCCKKDIYSFNTSPQVEKEKKEGMMDINLRYVAAVTYLRGYHLLNIHIKVISSILRKHEHIGGKKGRLHWTCAKTVGHCIT